ncbi:MAG: beta-galactosidase [Pseudomonadota bacterium]
MLGVCYYPEHWPKSLWQRDAEEMKSLGIEYVRLAEFAWCRLENAEGDYCFDWLDEVIDILHSQHLKVILCTPTATPPKWLIDKHPDILPCDIHTGQTRGFGSRRHCDFSSESFFNAAMKITQVMARRYANHPAVVGWQTDNEIACHDTTLSSSASALTAFRAWCKTKYNTIENLNREWGTIFWSMEYSSFDELELPLMAVTEAHPSHRLAYRRFSSDQVVRFHDSMVKEIKSHCKSHFITHNFIPMVDTQCDNFALAAPLDFASYDNYPLGRTDLFFSSLSSSEFERYMRTGHPDFASYSFDQIRGISASPFWIMEQQPGPVNWGGHNPKPVNGMVKFWSWEAIAHGASTISYFRWRQAAFAQEQMHAGIKRVDNSKSPAWHEIVSFRDELIASGLDLQSPVNASVAIVMDPHNQWVTEIERQGDSYVHQQVEFEYYSALRQLGLDVDFISQSSDLTPYKLIVAPCLPMVSQDFIDVCEKSDAHIIFGPRSGSKTYEFWLAPTLSPGKIQQLIDIQISSTETVRPDCVQPLEFGGVELECSRWLEYIDILSNSGVTVLARYVSSDANNHTAIVQNNKCTYIGCLMQTDSLIAVLSGVLESQDIDYQILPRDIRLSRRDGKLFCFNYNADSVSLQIDELENKTVTVGPRQVVIVDGV